jgi:hypothetical protein
MPAETPSVPERKRWILVKPWWWIGLLDWVDDISGRGSCWSRRASNGDEKRKREEDERKQVLPKSVRGSFDDWSETEGRD